MGTIRDGACVTMVLQLRLTRTPATMLWGMCDCLTYVSVRLRPVRSGRGAQCSVL